MICLFLLKKKLICYNCYKFIHIWLKISIWSKTLVYKTKQKKKKKCTKQKMLRIVSF